MPKIDDCITIDDQKISIAIEVEKEIKSESPFQDVRGLKDAAKNVQHMFEDGLHLIKNTAIRMVHGLTQIPEAIKPDEFQLEFAVKLDTELGAVIAKTETGAQLQVTFIWKSKK